MAELNELNLEEATGGSAVEPTVPYPIQFGDTLYGIAVRYNTTVKKLQELNGIANPDKIEAGKVIRIPTKGFHGGWN